MVLTLAVGAGAALGDGETQAQQSTSGTIGGLPVKPAEALTVASIDVHVCDKDGTQIEDLAAEDFQVLQDDKQKAITSFAHHSAEASLGVTQAQSPPGGASSALTEGGGPTAGEQLAPPSVYIVLFIDNNHLRAPDRNRVLSAMRGFVRQVMAPSVRIMVASSNGPLKILQPFTSDEEQVQGAIRYARTLEGALSERDDDRGRILREIHQTFDTRTSTRRTGQGYEGLYRLMNTFLGEYSFDVDRTIQSFTDVTTRTGGFSGQKCLIYVSNGIPMVPGKDFARELSALNQDGALRSMTSRMNKRRSFDAIASSANAQGVAIYTIDATGDDPTPGTLSERTNTTGGASYVNLTNNQEPLRLLADRTGGLAILNTNDFRAGFDQIKENLFTYYSIGYEINAAGGDKVHHVRVTLPEHPDHELRYGRTFVEKSLESQLQDQVTANLLLEPDDNPMQLKTAVGDPAPAGEGRWLLPVSVSFPTGSVALVPEGEDYVGHAVINLALSNTEGGQSESQRRDHEIRMPATEHEAPRNHEQTIEFRLLVQPGSYDISVGLLDPLTRQTSFETAQQVIRAAE